MATRNQYSEILRDRVKSGFGAEARRKSFFIAYVLGAAYGVGAAQFGGAYGKFPGGCGILSGGDRIEQCREFAAHAE